MSSLFEYWKHVMKGIHIAVFTLFFSVVIYAQEHQVEEIILVYKSHFDIGYTHLA
ncbi:unnamed protein product, partial [marine sediment metagenome]